MQALLETTAHPSGWSGLVRAHKSCREASFELPQIAHTLVSKRRYCRDVHVLPGEWTVAQSQRTGEGARSNLRETMSGRNQFHVERGIQTFKAHGIRLRLENGQGKSDPSATKT